MDTLKLVVLSLCVMGCGTHQSSSEYFEKSGEEIMIEEDQSPLEKMKRALFDGNLEQAQRLVQSGEVLITDKLPNGRSLLEESVYLIRFKLIRYFVSLGSQIETTNLMEWIESQPEKEMLLRALFKTEADDRLDLMALVEKGTYQEILTLINQSVEINFIDLKSNETPLTYSILNKKNSALRVLFSQNHLDVNMKNQFAESPLMMAKRLMLKNVEKELIKRNAQE